MTKKEKVIEGADGDGEAISPSTTASTPSSSRENNMTLANATTDEGENNENNNNKILSDPDGGMAPKEDVEMQDASEAAAIAIQEDQEEGDDPGRRRSKRRSFSPARYSNTNNAASAALTSTSAAPAPKKLKPNTTPKVKPKSNNAKKSMSSKKEKDLLDMSWICRACREAECAMDPDSDLIVCEGPCHRLFHFPCADLAAPPSEDSTEIWQCHDCQVKKHVCGFCQEYGQDQEDVFNCQKPECGFFFHEACLLMQNIPIASSNISHESKEGDEEEGTEPPKMLKFTCPAHWCWTCTQDDLNTAEPTSTTGATAAKGKQAKKKKQPSSNNFATKRDPRLFTCLNCPTGYHLTCIPPSAKFHELALLCHEHAATSELPSLDLEASMQGSVEASVEQKLNKIMNRDESLLARRQRAHKSLYKTKAGKNPFFPPGVMADRRTTREQLVLSKMGAMYPVASIPPPTAATSASNNNDEHQQPQVVSSSTMASDDPTKGGLLANDATNRIIAAGTEQDRILFCLPTDMQQEVHSKPPPYKHIHSLKYYPDKRPKRIDIPRDVCSCVDSCDDQCINRLLYVECFGNHPSGGTGANGGDGTRSSTNCRLGPKCGNRRLTLRQSVKKCKPEREKGRGWGLVTLEKVEKGALVQEYLGDVIDEATKEERLTEWSREHPNDTNFYIMCLSQGWYIDARETSNLARFINHSCDPNCILLRFNVGGYMRDGIFALRDLQPGEFLSYDYHFDTRTGDKFLCRCGSANCRGTMKERILKKDAAKKTKAQLWEAAKQQLEKDKEFLAEMEARQVWNSKVEAVLPGNSKTPSHFTAAGTTNPDEGYNQKADWVSNGVQDKDRINARRYRVFLWRNAVVGSDFSSRWKRYTTSNSNKNGGENGETNAGNSDPVVRRKPRRDRNTKSGSPSTPCQPVDVISVVLANQNRSKAKKK